MYLVSDWKFMIPFQNHRLDQTATVILKLPAVIISPGKTSISAECQLPIRNFWVLKFRSSSATKEDLDENHRKEQNWRPWDVTGTVETDFTFSKCLPAEEPQYHSQFPSPEINQFMHISLFQNRSGPQLLKTPTHYYHQTELCTLHLDFCTLAKINI